ncbi:CAP domain-containing protein [Cryptosporangium sp. NPDC048952]|uniref:CAP domain-containing protein n=1 Tax=Cryptosporangium sp. NPDC048952 TaxID=3363961 RepID=UPI003714688F
MHRRRRSPSRVRLLVGGAAVVAAIATGGIAVVGLTGDDASGDASAAIQTAETLEPRATDYPAVDDEPSESASPSANESTQRPRLPGGAPQAATGTSPSPKASSASPRARRTTKAPAASTGSPELAVLARINEARADEGLDALTMDTQLVAAAHAHNLQMADGCGLSHQCDGESGIGDRISAQGVQWSSVAENVGAGGPVDDDDSGQRQMAVGLTDSMLAEVPPDDGHRKNILNPDLSRIGIDVIRDDNGTVWLTHDFAD